jgi:hypothetical protein
MIVGGNKAAAITRYPLLQFYYDTFRQMLARGDSRLMVIGYGFGDDHINDCIREAVQKSNLKLFIVDLVGIDLLDSRRLATGSIPQPFEESRLLFDLHLAIIGASRRPLRPIIEERDLVEHKKLMKFFDPA